MRKARASSAPGPNRVPYKLYKNFPKVLDVLWYLMRAAWKKQLIPFEWQKVAVVLIPMETNSKNISQVRNIALNVEGKISDIPSSTVNKMDGKAKSLIRKCHGASLKRASIFERNTLQLLLKSIGLVHKQEKTRIVLELRESTDQTVRNVNIKVLTGRRWNAQIEVDQAISHLQHQGIVDRVQAGRAGLGWGEVPRFWSKAKAARRGRRWWRRRRRGWRKSATRSRP